MKSLHLIGSNHMGGAERWFTRFLAAMLRQREDVEAAVRRGSELARHHMAGIPHRELPFRTVWDPLSRHAVSQLVAASDAAIVQGLIAVLLAAYSGRTPAEIRAFPIEELLQRLKLPALVPMRSNGLFSMVKRIQSLAEQAETGSAPRTSAAAAPLPVMPLPPRITPASTHHENPTPKSTGATPSGNGRPATSAPCSYR